MWTKKIQFELLELLGEGSQGLVHKALRHDPDSGLRQTVAIKILHSRIAVELWRQEFESLSRIRSPYCVQVLSFERFRRRPALVLEYVDGISLAQLGQTCLLNESDINEILAQLERALQDLHSQKVLHGDLSPQNILLDREGRLRVLDFGMANCDPAHARTTPQFASPERLAGQPADFASDLFSLGRVEVFLRGTEGENLASPYLETLPALRRFQGLLPCPVRQLSLANKVNALLSRRKLSGELQTRTQNIQRPKAWSVRAFVLGTITSFMVLTTSSASQGSHSHKVGLLSLRTQRWHYFIVNGQPIGYSPVSLPLNANESYHLEWISAKGHGAKDLAVRAEEAVTLEDSDFSH